jgi:hypothetical protein
VDQINAIRELDDLVTTVKSRLGYDPDDTDDQADVCLIGRKLYGSNETSAHEAVAFLRTAFMYVLFDLEATRRESARLLDRLQGEAGV